MSGSDTVADAGELRILLVEDSILLQERLSEMLTEPGVMRVTGTAVTEREAVQRITSHDFDVLLVDVELREGSGIGAILKARSTYEDRQPLIIVLTNYPLPAVRTRCIAAGADHFLDKMREIHQVRPLIQAVRRRSGG